MSATALPCPCRRRRVYPFLYALAWAAWALLSGLFLAVCVGAGIPHLYSMGWAGRGVIVLMGAQVSLPLLAARVMNMQPIFARSPEWLVFAWLLCTIAAQWAIPPVAAIAWEFGLKKPLTGKVAATIAAIFLGAMGLAYVVARHTLRF